ncbi:MAG: hypothetical protein AB1489_29090 [Acidobacteriota bacterium]
MKRPIAAICLTAFLIANIACQRGDNNLLTEPMFKLAVEKQFNVAKQRLEVTQFAGLFNPPIDTTAVLFEQKESGNAAQLYWEALKPRVETTAEETQRFLDELSPVLQALNAAITANVPISPNAISDEAVKKEAEKAAQLPELAKLETGAQRKYSRLVGEVVPIPENPMALQPIPLTLLNSYAGALMVKGLLKEAAGDKAAAEKLLQTVIAIGQHFTQDPNYHHYFNGRAVMKFGCLGLKPFYQRQANTVKQQAVEQLEKALDEQAQRLTAELSARDDTGQIFNIITSLGYLDEGIDPLMRIVGDENVPLAFRASALQTIYAGYMFRFMMVERSGRAPETSEYAAPSQTRVQAFTRLAASPDKTLAEIATKSQQVLVKMQGLNNAERMKYWREISKPKS